MLGDLVLVDDLADANTDRILAAELARLPVAGTLANAASVASSRSSRLGARSLARTALRHATKRSPG